MGPEGRGGWLKGAVLWAIHLSLHRITRSPGSPEDNYSNTIECTNCLLDSLETRRQLVHSIVLE